MQCKNPADQLYFVSSMEYGLVLTYLHELQLASACIVAEFAW